MVISEDMLWHLLLGFLLLFAINRVFRQQISAQFKGTVWCGFLLIVAGYLLEEFCGHSPQSFVEHQLFYIPGIAGVGVILLALRAKYAKP